MYYSDNPSQFIFLDKPAWVVEDGAGGAKFVDLEITGILITPEQKIDHIEFLNK
jgi:hypothetical protein